MFRFIIRGRNCEPYLGACFNSLQLQTVQDWCALVLVDPSEDDTVEAVCHWMDKEPRITARFNKEHLDVCRNMWQGLSEIGTPLRNNGAAQDNDVVAILDLDDYLYRPNALEIIENYYNKYPGLMATYGSFRFKPTFEKSNLCRPYREHDHPRKAKWRASHLKTFRYSLVKHIPQDYFMHNGEWGKAASDLALMFCVMELSGMDRIKHVRESVYYYRNHTPNSVKRDLQKKWEWRWRAKKPLKRVS